MTISVFKNLSRLSIALLLIVLAFNVIRFIGLETSPPGFYIDEAAISTQVLCVRQTGSDFYHDHLPLFSHEFGAFTTPPYLYGQVMWTSIFGDSTGALRGFVAFATMLTILFLFLWMRRRTDSQTALWAALFSTISPWAFQFSRIAWDPPLAPMFLMLALWSIEWKKYKYIWAGVFFSLAAYSYPPMRVQALVLLVFLPGIEWKKKAKVFAAFLVTSLPLLRRSMDADFLARSKLVAIWSDYPSNPYHDASLFGLGIGFLKQLSLHLTPDFLLFHGDHNVRHSIQTFGMISYPEFAMCAIALFFLVKNRKSDATGTSLTLLAGIGLMSGLASAALTWEGVPHALRAIGAWPFFCILAALGVRALFQQNWIKKNSNWIGASLASACIVFFALYLDDYFNDYPTRAEAWFQGDDQPLTRAYFNMTENHISCQDLRR